MKTGDPTYSVLNKWDTGRVKRSLINHHHVISFPNAKINLGLFVTGKRPDGFHSIESIFIPVPFCDVLEVIRADEPGCTFTSSGRLIDGMPADNIVVKAWMLMHKNYHIGGVKVHLHKVIPMGAGLGGGSSDGAFMLRALNVLFELNLSLNQLEQLAAQLGSDCPFFIRNQPACVSGRGEVLEPVAECGEHFWLALLTPGIHVSTPLAYSWLTPKPAPVNLRECILLPFSEWCSDAVNDFEQPVTAHHPGITEARNALLRAGAFYTSMSGSGSAVYGLFHSKPALPEAWIGNIKW
jgi:4-diphosphocytidyl-2-C-methyl-D-erythritol kinase